MKNFSEEVIEVEGKEYKLFLNRAGIALLEKTTKFSEFLKLLSKQYVGIEENSVEVNEEFNPNEILNKYENIDNDEEKLRQTVIMFYCIALSANHNLNLSQTKEWFEKAENGTINENGESNNDGYGIDQLVALMIQMIENANIPSNSENLKNLKALKSTK